MSIASGCCVCRQLTRLMCCCCRRKTFLTTHRKMLIQPCLFLALREHEASMDVSTRHQFLVHFPSV